MKTIATSIAAVLAMLATAHPPRYILKDLGTLPGANFSQGTYINNNGSITGVSNTRANPNVSHAVLWSGGRIIDIATTGLGGPNSGALGVNTSGQVAGWAESSERDPNQENFCGYGTGLQCWPFLWQNGDMIKLPLLGGNNGAAGPINIRGEAVGIAETADRDPECPGSVAVNGTGPQVLNFQAALWGPAPAQVRKLPHLPGDRVGEAFAINDFGQVVGVSGSCANTILPGFAGGPHVVLWDTDHSVHRLPDFGGTIDPANRNVLNSAWAINNIGEIAGQLVLPGSTPDVSSQSFRAVLWTTDRVGNRVPHDLKTLHGDLNSAALAMNNVRVVAGASLAENGNSRAFVWQNGVMEDLNELIPPESHMYLVVAFGINDAGQIVGFGATKNGEIHGFLATPNTGAALRQR